MIVSSQRTNSLFFALLFLICTGGLLGCGQEQEDAQTSEGTTLPELKVDTSMQEVEQGDVPFVETPQVVVDSMLALAEVSEDDVVYDLGSGDGRIPITAAETYGARGVGIEIDPDLVEEARQNARDAGVEDLVEIRQGDLFDADISNATVVTLYLLPDVNIKLRSKLFRELSPGSRVVSHGFDMDEWTPDERRDVGGNIVYLWTIPEESPSFVEE